MISGDLLGSDAVWTVSADGTVSRINTATLQAEDIADAGGGKVADIAAEGNVVWVTFAANPPIH